MPELGLLLLAGRVEGRVLLHLNDESDLCGVAKVGDGESADLLNEGLTSEFELVLALFDQVLDLVWLELHDTSNAQL